MKFHESPYINRRKKTIEFYVHHLNSTSAAHICLAGSFNHWSPDELKLQPAEDGLEDFDSYVAKRQVLLQVLH
jgi:hypothetical protein